MPFSRQVFEMIQPSHWSPNLRNCSTRWQLHQKILRLHLQVFRHPWETWLQERSQSQHIKHVWFRFSWYQFLWICSLCMALNLLLEGKNNQVKNKELPHKRPTSSVVSHSSRKKGGAHCAEATKGPCEIGRCLVSRFEEPWGGLQRPGVRSQELQNKPQKMVMVKHSKGRWKDIGKIWQAINAKRRVLLEDYICTQGQDRRADSDPFGCQQVSHFSPSRRKDFVNDFLSSLLRRSGCLLGRNNFSSCPRHWTLDDGRWTCDGPWTMDDGPVILSHQRCNNSKVCADSPPPKKRSTKNTYLNLFSCMDQNYESPLSWCHVCTW